MPELPEVEVICRGLQKHILGRCVKEVHCSGKHLRTPVNCTALSRELCGQSINSLTRRAKYLLLQFTDGATLVIHLGMTGNMGIFAKGSTTKKHDHICWTLDNKTELRFNDTRRFGAIHLFPAEEASKGVKTFFAKTGPEPFSRTCSAKYLFNRAITKKQAVKSYIMDSHIIAGIGNIYANESLFRTGIHPLRPASSLTEKEWKRLLTVIRKTLKHAIQCGGSTISDFVNASGEGGYFQMNFQIYGRDGKPCRTCQETIQKMTIGGRTSFFCPRCQRNTQGP